MSHHNHHISASPFVVEWIKTLASRAPAPRRALDVAMGRGRHALELARSGFRAFGVDLKLDVVRGAVRAAIDEQLTVRAWCADLTVYPLPVAAFEVVIVSRYLQRNLFGALRDALAPGGFVVYETFTVLQRALGVGPTSPEHLLEPGELQGRFEGLEVLFYEEVSAPEAMARLVARKRQD